MTNKLTERLNKILPKITDKSFLQGKGLGNEIAFYIFDYAPQDELSVREHIHFLLGRIERQHNQIKVIHIDLFKTVIEYLKKRQLLDKSFTIEQTKGIDGLFRALKAPLKAEVITQIIRDDLKPQEYDLVLMSGVGNIWPLMRSHSLLNNLQPIMGKTPLALFYPGNYDKQSLKLFGKLKSDNYYRAFPLVP